MLEYGLILRGGGESVLITFQFLIIYLLTLLINKKLLK